MSPTNGKMVSIVMPSYNSEKTVKESALSALAQSHENIELIVVDDGSTDRTLDVIRSIKDERVVVVQCRHSGVSAARNAGLAIARGQYIRYLDSDDLLGSTAVEKQLEKVLAKSGVGFCTCSWGRFEN